MLSVLSCRLLFLRGEIKGKKRTLSLRDAKLLRVAMDKSLNLGLEVGDPLHGEEGLERGVLHWVRDVWQRIVSQKF